MAEKYKTDSGNIFVWSSKNPYNQSYTSSVSSVKKTLKKLYGPFFMDGVQLPQG